MTEEERTQAISDVIDSLSIEERAALVDAALSLRIEVGVIPLHQIETWPDMVDAHFALIEALEPFTAKAGDALRERNHRITKEK